MRPLRICVDCSTRHRLAGPRCADCERRHQRARNAARTQYAGTWRSTSKRRRKAAGVCARCGATDDLTLDHETGQVECRSCNSSHRRDPQCL